MFLCLSVVLLFLLFVRVNSFRPSSSHSAAGSHSFWFVCKDI